ncbi:MAG: hypothetical protein KDL87_17315, partial [Verrucomicrobiae bacterium]|nr:hypothetical protein [Verrucomicrobiae bacterium]
MPPTIAALADLPKEMHARQDRHVGTEPTRSAAATARIDPLVAMPPVRTILASRLANGQTHPSPGQRPGPPARPVIHLAEGQIHPTPSRMSQPLTLIRAHLILG